ncbi:MAG: hypothetical protein ACK4WC_15835, partial [Rubrimonas sp.]
ALALADRSEDEDAGGEGPGPGFGPDDFAPVDLAAVARAAADEIAPALKAAGVAVEIGPLPTVRGLEPLLRLAFRALFETALARPRGAPSRIRATAGEGRSVVMSDDGAAEGGPDGDGPRAPALALERMICRRAMEVHGGELREAGATATLSFP